MTKFTQNLYNQTKIIRNEVPPNLIKAVGSEIDFQKNNNKTLFFLELYTVFSLLKILPR